MRMVPDREAEHEPAKSILVERRGARSQVLVSPKNLHCSAACYEAPAVGEIITKRWNASRLVPGRAGVEAKMILVEVEPD